MAWHRNLQIVADCSHPRVNALQSSCSSFGLHRNIRECSQQIQTNDPTEHGAPSSSTRPHSPWACRRPRSQRTRTTTGEPGSNTWTGTRASQAVRNPNQTPHPRTYDTRPQSTKEMSRTPQPSRVRATTHPSVPTWARVVCESAAVLVALAILTVLTCAH